MRASDNKKTRIFCAITLGEIGGAQQFILQLVSRLNPSRYDIMVVTGAQGRQDLASQLPEYVHWRSATSLRRNISPLHDIRVIGELRTMMDDFSPNIVLLNSSKAGFVGSLAARPLRKKYPSLKVIYRIGGWTFNDPWPAWKKMLFVWMEKFSSRYKDIIVVNNHRDLEDARVRGILPRDRVVMIHNGVDPYRTLLSKDGAREELVERVEQTSGVRPSFSLVIGVIANFYPTKGLFSLLRAAAQTPNDYQFVIIGDGPLRGELEQRIVELGLQQRVFLTGMLADARRLVTAFDMMVLPSLKEGFPWSVLESMAAKVPLVVTRVGAIPEVVEDRVSALIATPGESEELAKKIRMLGENAQLRQDLAIRAHQRLLADFTLRTMISRYERLFMIRPDGASR